MVKAGPTDETAEEFFSKNQTGTFTNNVIMENVHYDNSKKPKDSENVTVESDLLEKTLDKSQAEDEGYLTWTIYYQPYGFEHEEAYIEDMLPDGIELRTDAQGKLDLTDEGIQIYEMILNDDGTFDPNNDPVDNIGELVTYDLEERILSFTLPDISRGYKIGI